MNLIRICEIIILPESLPFGHPTVKFLLNELQMLELQLKLLELVFHRPLPLKERMRRGEFASLIFLERCWGEMWRSKITLLLEVLSSSTWRGTSNRPLQHFPE